MGRRPPSPEPVLVERQEQVEALCAQCRADGAFAFDTEFVMEDRYESDICLLQVATAGMIAVIDPFLEVDLRPVWNLVIDEDVETVVHAGQEDLALAVQHTGTVPHNVFDVQIAAGLVGCDYPMSLQRLVQSTMHIRLHKSKTLTDWRRRPLTPAQIDYGAEDVVYLLRIRRMLGERLQSLSRVDWAREEFRRFENITFYRRAEEDKIARVKGAGSLSGQQLAVAYELLRWREAFAQRVNRPARVVFKDHLLVEIAKHAMVDFSEIRALRGLTLPDRDVRALCRIVKSALEIPSERWPTPKPREHESPSEVAVVSLASAVARSYCMENELAYGLVATQKSIRDLVRHRSGQILSADAVELLNGWRGASVGAVLDEVLSGSRSVGVARVDGEMAVRVHGPTNAG